VSISGKFLVFQFWQSLAISAILAIFPIGGKFLVPDL
jgi:hypothetical protein